jgi:hypothetical protein
MEQNTVNLADAIIALANKTNNYNSIFSLCKFISNSRREDTDVCIDFQDYKFIVIMTKLVDDSFTPKTVVVVDKHDSQHFVLGNIQDLISFQVGFLNGRKRNTKEIEDEIKSSIPEFDFNIVERVIRALTRYE